MNTQLSKNVNLILQHKMSFYTIIMYYKFPIFVQIKIFFHKMYR